VLSRKAHKSKSRGESAMKRQENQRIEEITEGTLVVGIDIAKRIHWARFVDYRGMEVSKAVSFKSNREGFEAIVSKIELISKNKVHKKPINKVVIGMEPTGHYWKTLAHYLMKAGYRVVCVNPHHTKKAKELDDNSPTASDKKEALVIARLVKDGRYFTPYLPEDVYAELRGLSNARVNVMKRNNAVKNNIIAILDEYFPEIYEVFKKPLTGKASRQVLRSCPFPSIIIALGEMKVLSEIKKAVKKSVGIKKVRQLIEVAKTTVGVTYGLESARLRLEQLLDELELVERHSAQIEISMEQMLQLTGYAESVLSIKGIGIVTAAGFLGEVGDPLRFGNARQIANYAGYNLIENSSGNSKSGTIISKRGRSQFRSLLYKMAFTMVGQNAEMKALHKYFTTRANNPLKKKQSLVAVSIKIITVIYNLLKKQAMYDPALALGAVRLKMIQKVA
jgi:transposase